MCGRYFLSLSPELLRRLFGTETIFNYTPSRNVTPLQQCPLIVRRRMGAGRWGLLPDTSGSDNKALCAKLKNARSETVMEKPTFAALWRKGRRCLVPASGFYEWPEVKVKGQPPFQVTADGAECIVFAGLWTKLDDLVTFTTLTQASSPALSSIHSRMPVAFLPAQADRWFSSSPAEAFRMMRNESLTDWQAERIENLVA